MAGEDCCKLVGDLKLNIDGCIISVSTGCNTEIITACADEPQEGPSTTTVNLSGYANSDLWVGCPSKAGVSIPFVRKYDCENDILYLIFSGQGQSFFTGDADELVTLNTTLETTCASYSASSSSGPATLS